MREIKFRAWTTESKKMFHDVGFCSRGIEVYWYDPELAEETVLGDRRQKSLLQYTIPMQYTGLKDKNGKEIYEGDVITYKLWSHIEPQTDIVEFSSYGFSPMNFLECTSDGSETEHTFEVIGNIYENPELLKGGKNERY